MGDLVHRRLRPADRCGLTRPNQVTHPNSPSALATPSPAGWPGGILRPEGFLGVHRLPGPGLARATFVTWQQALALDDVRESVSGGGAVAWLRARAWRSGVRVTVTATVFTSDERVVTS